MDYEKAYKAVLETATQWIKDGCTDKEKICLECVFPELRESEDERIRKELLDCLRNLTIKPHEKKLRFMAWLERLNLADLNIMKEFNKGMQEALMWGREGYEVSPDGKVKSLTQDEIDSVLEKQKEPENVSASTIIPSCWAEEPSLQQEQKLDDVKREWWNKGYLEGRKNAHIPARELGLPNSWDFQQEQKPVEYLPKRKVYDIMNKLTELSTSDLIPFESEEYVKIHEITSDVCSLLNYPIEQKPAEWSEEDEKDMAHIIRILDDCYAYGRHDLSKTDHENLVNKLKSIRPSWKPSEEQMDALKRAVNKLAKSDVADSVRLSIMYDNLKKLM